MNTSDNCQNCDAKDKVTIAGKTFCANCGTPQNNTGDPQTTDGAMTTVSADVAPAINSAPPKLADPPEQSPHDELVESLTQSLSGSAGILSKDTTSSSDQSNVENDVQKASLDTQAVAVPPAQDNSPNIINTPAVATSAPVLMQAQVSKTPTPQPQVPIQSSQPSNIQKFSAVQRPFSATSTADIKAPVAANTSGVLDLQAQASNKPVATQPPSPIAVDSIKPETNTNGVGTELGSLDGKDEHVFSDDQFKALEQTTNDRPVDVRALSQKPNPQVNPVSDIRPSEITTPGQIITPGAVPSSEPATTPSLPVNQTSPATPQINHITQSVLTPELSNTPSSAVAQTNQPVAQPATPSPAVAAMLEPTEDAKTQKPKSSLAKKGTKVGTVAMTAVGLLLLGAYVWQVNYPNLALKVASSKAGINASIPSYLPSGWQVSGDINSNPGSISYQLASADGKASATVNEKKTDWDSQALAENYVNNQSDKYLALQAEGLTIYVYNNQASWVNNGTWYRIEGQNTGLSQDQLIRMATSL